MSSRRLPIPKEHGAWVMLVQPFIIGVGVAGRLVPEALFFLIAAVSFFAARYPLSLAIKSRSKRADEMPRESLQWLAIYVAIGGISGVFLLFAYGRWELIPLGAAALLMLALQPLLQRNRLDRTTAAELLAFAGLALTGPGAYYVSTGELGPTAALLWLLSFLYAGAGVFYVKLRVKQRMLRGIALTQVQRLMLGLNMALYQVVLAAIVVSLAVSGLIPWLALAAFAPLTWKVVRHVWHISSELNLRRLGLIELVHSVAFTALLVAAFLVR